MLVEITSSPARRRMPWTPHASRPIRRTSVSWKRIARPVAHLDRDDPVGLEVRVVRLELGLLDDPVLRRKDEVLGLLELAGLNDGAHLLVLAERQQVDDRAALRLARAERKLVHLEPVDL